MQKKERSLKIRWVFGIGASNDYIIRDKSIYKRMLRVFVMRFICCLRTETNPVRTRLRGPKGHINTKAIKYIYFPAMFSRTRQKLDSFGFWLVGSEFCFLITLYCLYFYPTAQGNVIFIFDKVLKP